MFCIERNEDIDATEKRLLRADGLRCVERVLGQRKVKDKNPEYLVQWKSHSCEFCRQKLESHLNPSIHAVTNKKKAWLSSMQVSMGKVKKRYPRRKATRSKVPEKGSTRLLRKTLQNKNVDKDNKKSEKKRKPISRRKMYTKMVPKKIKSSGSVFIDYNCDADKSSDCSSIDEDNDILYSFPPEKEKQPLINSSRMRGQVRKAVTQKDSAKHSNKNVHLKNLQIMLNPLKSMLTNNDTPSTDSEITFNMSNSWEKTHVLKKNASKSMKVKPVIQRHSSKPHKQQHSAYTPPNNLSTAHPLPRFFNGPNSYSSPQKAKSCPRDKHLASHGSSPDAVDSFWCDLPTVPVIPIIPRSPSAASYKALMNNFPSNLQSQRSVKRKLSDKDEVVRRISVRQSESVFKYKEIVVKKSPGFTQIWLFTNTKVKNSLNPTVFQEILSALYNAKYDDSRVVMLSGSGNTFCSGIDLAYLSADDVKTQAVNMATAVRNFTNALISFPKPVVAAVNGPAIGLGVAMLGLCDIVYASDKASFYTPYGRLNQTPEGCASYLFPQIMGMAMANEMLLGGRKLTAMEAYQIGLVSQVFWPTSLMQEVIPRLENLAVCSSKALEASKMLIRSHQRAKLEYTMESEINILEKRWPTAECQKAITNYLEDEQDLLF